MELEIYQVDAFANKLFSGNPAAVVPLETWLPDELMQKLALENNLRETVFFVPAANNEADYDIRWFTPALEINLCGHATLAAAYIIFNYLFFKKPVLTFQSKSGKLTVERRAELLVLDFPAWKPERYTDYPEELQTALGNVEMIGVYQHRDMLVELNDATAVKNCQPDFTLLKKMGIKLIITALGQHPVDFVSRFFAPIAGVDEDPVTGSAHSQLIPFWAEKLNKTKLHALQLSARGGELWCGHWGDRVSIGGQCVFYMKGTIYI